MAENMTSMDFDGNSDSGIGTGSDSQSVSSEATLIGSPTPSVQLGSTSSGYNSGHNGAFPHQTQVGEQLGQTEVLPTLAGSQDSLTSTQEWLDKHFDVFVKTLEGKTVTIQTSEDENVTSFRAKVDEKTGVPGTQQRLTSQSGRTLEDGKTLRDYSIGKHCTIYCQGRLRGGSSIYII